VRSVANRKFRSKVRVRRYNYLPTRYIVLRNEAQQQQQQQQRPVQSMANRTFSNNKTVGKYNDLPKRSKELTNEAINSDQLLNIHKHKCRTLDQPTEQEWQEGEIHLIFVGISKLFY
jgi:hypothetical protein